MDSCFIKGETDSEWTALLESQNTLVSKLQVEVGFLESLGRGSANPECYLILILLFWAFVAYP